MQALPRADSSALLDRLTSDALPAQRGVGAWRSFIQAHASLMRELTTDLGNRTGLSLGDFDVLVQLAVAGGELRMTDLAARAFSSRSGMTRRIDRLVEEGLVGRAGAGTDARGVVVALTTVGLERLVETVPVHLGAVSRLFVERLDDQELAVLERALNKVAVDCTFG